MVQVDGPESVVQGVGNGDVALIASLINAFVAAVLVTRALIMLLFPASGDACKSNKQHSKVNGTAPNAQDDETVAPLSSAGILKSVVILFVGLACGYILSNTLTVGHHIAVTTETLQNRFESAIDDVKSIQQQYQAATEDHEQCRIESADMQSELKGKLAATEAVIAQCDAAASEVESARNELARVKTDMSSIISTQQSEINRLKAEIKSGESSRDRSNAELEKKLASKEKLVAHLKNEMVAMGERFGVDLGNSENRAIEAQESKRKFQSENVKMKKELEKLQAEIDRLKLVNDGVEKKLKRETDSHAATMDEYSVIVLQLKEVHDEIRRFLKEGDGEGLRRFVQ